MPRYRQVTIVGVGLMGGSVGLALLRRGLADEVIGVGRSEESRRRAEAAGAVTRTTQSLQDAASEAEVVVVATPVATLADTICQAVQSAPPTALVTDVGSTKQLICEEVEQRFRDKSCSFVGSHPLAGDHRTGPENARDDLLEGRTVVVTPSATTPTELVMRAAQFWEALGAQVTQMAPSDHDRALAATSHLPHLVASVLAAATPREALPLAASGWADTTRVAAGDPELWTQIFSQNAPATIEKLDVLLHRLEEFRQCLASQDWAHTRKILEEAKQIRDALGS